MDPETLVTFWFKAPEHVHRVELLGSWDNFTVPYQMHFDRRTARHTGCFHFDNIVFDGDKPDWSKPRSGGLKQGGVYWYYFRLDFDVETYDDDKPHTAGCPLMPGQVMNMLEVPTEIVLPPSRSRSLCYDSIAATSAAMASTGYSTLEPSDRYAALEPPPISRVHVRCLSDMALNGRLEGRVITPSNLPALPPPPSRDDECDVDPLEMRPSKRRRSGDQAGLSNHQQEDLSAGQGSDLAAVADAYATVSPTGDSQHNKSPLKSSSPVADGKCDSLRPDPNAFDFGTSDGTTTSNTKPQEKGAVENDVDDDSIYGPASVRNVQMYGSPTSKACDLDHEWRPRLYSLPSESLLEWPIATATASPSTLALGYNRELQDVRDVANLSALDERNDAQTQAQVAPGHASPEHPAQPTIDTEPFHISDELWSPTFSAATVSSNGLNTPFRLSGGYTHVPTTSTHDAQTIDDITQRLQSLNNGGPLSAQNSPTHVIPEQRSVDATFTAYSLPQPAIESVSSRDKFSTPRNASVMSHDYSLPPLGVQSPLAALEIYPTSHTVQRLRDAVQQRTKVLSLSHFLATNPQDDVFQTHVPQEEALTCWGILTHSLNVQYIILDKLEVSSAVGKAWLAQGTFVLEGTSITMEMMFRLIRTMRPGDLAVMAMRHKSKELVAVYNKLPWTIEAVVKAAFPGFPSANSHGDGGNYHLHLPRTDTSLPSGSYTGVAGLAQNSPRYVPPPKGSRSLAPKKEHERRLYQFNAWEGVEQVITSNFLAVYRHNHGLPSDDALGPALLLMEATFGPLNGSTMPEHHLYGDSRYRAMLPSALLTAFGLPSGTTYPLSVLSGPLKTVPQCSDLPTRSSMAASRNLAPRLLRGSIVSRDNTNAVIKYRLASRNSSVQLDFDISSEMIEHGWDSQDFPFSALDMSPSFHPKNFARLTEFDLEPNYEHAGKVALELFYFAAKSDTIRYVFVPYSFGRGNSTRYSSAMAARTLYEAAHEDVVPSNRRIETLSGISFEGHELGPDILSTIRAHCLFCPATFTQGERQRKGTEQLVTHLNIKGSECANSWAIYRRGKAQDANIFYHPYICEAVGCSRPFLKKLKFIEHLRESTACLRDNPFWVDEFRGGMVK
ncbi:hypothetical protein LTR15_002661 [Elasticomyces elasticus]|nr:hypothetical protein LTR15_002661 [Elasticomyces elasticus]